MNEPSPSAELWDEMSVRSRIAVEAARSHLLWNDDHSRDYLTRSIAEYDEAHAAWKQNINARIAAKGSAATSLGPDDAQSPDAIRPAPSQTG